jgi:hypothetical protein
MKLPGLLIDQNVQTTLECCAEIWQSPARKIDLDGSNVVAIEPVAACLLAVSARRVSGSGKRLAITGLRPALRTTLRQFNVGIHFPDDEEGDAEGDTSGACVSRHVRAASHANAAANEMANYMAQFIPTEDRNEMLRDQYGLRIHHAIQPALAYVLTELLDNVFCHAAAEPFPNPNAWVSVQSYPQGDLMRLAVVDDGCGLLASLRDIPEPPKNHFEATTRAFQPFLTSKGVPLLYAERRHMGLGLPVCNAICRSLDGAVYTVTGNAWVERPNTERQANKTAARFMQGTIVSIELHRRAATTNLLKDILASFSGSPDLRLRFD